MQNQTTNPELPSPVKRLSKVQLIQAEIPVELFEQMEKLRLKDPDHPITRKSIVEYGIKVWLSRVSAEPRKK